jgi:hypothetical protein
MGVPLIGTLRNLRFAIRDRVGLCPALGEREVGMFAVALERGVVA